MAGFAPQLFKPRDNRDFVKPLWRGVQPRQQPRHGHRVAQMGRACTSDLDRVLARLGQGAGVALPGDFNARLFQLIPPPDRRGRRVKPDRAVQRRQRGRKVLGWKDVHILAKMRSHPVIGLGRVNKQIHAAIGVKDGKAQHDRHALDIIAADVQQPVDAVGFAQHTGLMPCLPQAVAQTAAFLGAGFACIFEFMHNDAPGRGRRLVGPDAVNQIVDALQGDVAALKCLLNFVDFAFDMQPGVKADDPPLGKLRAQPVGQPGFGPVNRGEVIGIDLRADLQTIAPVNKHARDILQRGAEPGRAGKARQPGKALVARRHPLALMGVAAGHQKAGQPLACHLATQCGKARRAIGGTRCCLERLQHGRPFHGRSRYTARLTLLMPMTRARARGSLSNRAASCSVMAPASCSTSVMVTARS